MAVADQEMREVLALVERRLDVLGELADSLVPARPRTIADHVVLTEQRSGRQRKLLADWARIEAEIGPWRQQWPHLFSASLDNTSLTREVRERWLEYRDQYLQLLGTLQARCRVEAAVLRRFWRTAAALSSFLVTTEPTYAPRLPRSSALESA